MDTINLLPIIGIIATLVTFGLVYWRVTSARKEREKHALKDIVVVLARILAQGQDSLDLPLVESLIKSKAREHDINLSTADELPKIVEDLVAKFTESEFITPEVRQKLTEKVMLLEKQLERKEAKFEEAVAEYRQPARREAYRRNVALSTMAALLAIFATVVIATFSDLIVTRDLFAFLIPILLVTAFATYAIEYRQLKKKEAEKSLHVKKVFDRIVTEALSEIVPTAIVSHNVRIVQDDYYVEADLVVDIDDERIPIEIKLGTVRRETIDTLASIAKKLGATAGILITSSHIDEQIKKMALEHNIVLLEDIAAKEDLIRKLKTTRFFE